MIKNKEKKEELEEYRLEKERERMKMKEDLLRKRKEMQKKKGNEGLIVEIVGVPDFMKPEFIEKQEKPRSDVIEF